MTCSQGIPTTLYVIDYMHWKRMGDYTFNPDLFPDPAGMVRLQAVFTLILTIHLAIHAT